MSRDRKKSVRALLVDDIPEVSAVVARAFEDDPLYEWFLPDTRSRVKKATALSEILLRRLLPLDFMDIYTTSDQAGVAMWAGPEKWEPPNRVMLTAMPRVLLTIGLTGAGRMAGAMGLMKKHHPHEPHWYLMGLATDPPSQRTGVGSALVAPVLARCDADKLGAYLETQKQINVPYYERFGFRVTNEVDLPKGGPHLWLMWRDPQ